MKLSSRACTLAAATASLLLAVTAFAQDTIEPARANTDLDRQRMIFVDAERALRRGNRRRFRQLKSQIPDYPLYTYLQYRELRRYLSYATPTQVSSFLDEYADMPLADHLRAAWLKLLARRGQWAEYLEAYRPTTSVPARCRQLYALVKTGRAAKALPQVAELWLAGESQPRACDPLFAAWMNAGYLNDTLVWQRVELALGAGQSSLAGYLARFLSSDDQRWVELWRRVHSDPKLVLRHRLFRKDHASREPILLYGIRRLTRRDTAQAAVAWQRIAQRYPFSDEQRWSVERDLALNLARSGDAGGLASLAALPESAQNEQVQTWRIITALRQGAWAHARQWIESLPEDERYSDQWRYWNARILEALGGTKESAKLYGELAETRGYYGFLAADRLEQPYNLDHTPLPGTAADVAQLMEVPGVQRAHELLALGRVIDARREWRALTREMDQQALLHATKLAQQWGWHDRAIFTAARARFWDDLNARFPLAYEDEVKREAGSRKLDSAWVLAMLRQESAFVADARSSAGALGLMQLMPRTARSVARRLNTRVGNERDILGVDLNIRLGTHYLRSVLDELGNNPVLATAAYNAGPNRVKRWIPEDRLLPADLWVETVPFRETRDYLRRVLSYTVIYEHRLGRDATRLRDRMHPVGDSTRLLTGVRSERPSAGAS